MTYIVFFNIYINCDFFISPEIFNIFDSIQHSKSIIHTNINRLFLPYIEVSKLKLFRLINDINAILTAFDGIIRDGLDFFFHCEFQFRYMEGSFTFSDLFHINPDENINQFIHQQDAPQQNSAIIIRGKRPGPNQDSIATILRGLPNSYSFNSDNYEYFLILPTNLDSVDPTLSEFLLNPTGRQSYIPEVYFALSNFDRGHIVLNSRRATVWAMPDRATALEVIPRIGSADLQQLLVRLLNLTSDFILFEDRSFQLSHLDRMDYLLNQRFYYWYKYCTLGRDINIYSSLTGELTVNGFSMRVNGIMVNKSVLQRILYRHQDLYTDMGITKILDDCYVFYSTRMKTLIYVAYRYCGEGVDLPNHLIILSDHGPVMNGWAHLINEHFEFSYIHTNRQTLQSVRLRIANNCNDISRYTVLNENGIVPQLELIETLENSNDQ